MHFNFEKKKEMKIWGALSQSLVNSWRERDYFKLSAFRSFQFLSQVRWEIDSANTQDFSTIGR